MYNSESFVERFRQSNPYEFEALVAQHVHGFRWMKNRVRRSDFYSDPPKFPIGGLCLVPPDQFSQLDIWAFPPKGIKCTGRFEWVKNYSTSAKIDLESHRVACSWDSKLEIEYFDSLIRIFRRRTKQPVLGATFDMRYYKVGDYSAAALCIAAGRIDKAIARLRKCLQ